MNSSNTTTTNTLAGHYVSEVFQDAGMIASTLTGVTGVSPGPQTVMQIAEMILRVAEQQAEGTL
jgi:hypothetical protein